MQRSLERGASRAFGPVTIFQNFCESFEIRTGAARYLRPMLRDDSLTTPLPVRYAFVVRFNHDADPGEGHFVGEIEHLVSGYQGRFATRDEMFTFMQEHLHRNRAPEAGVVQPPTDEERERGQDR